MSTTTTTVTAAPQASSLQPAAPSSSAAPGAEAMVAALKRKLIEQDSALSKAQSRNDELESGLQMEKREHQLTTSKLSQLLKKRGNNNGPDAEKDVSALKQHISLLQQQVLLAEEREGQLRQQLAALAHQLQHFRKSSPASVEEEEATAASQVNGQSAHQAAEATSDASVQAQPSATDAAPAGNASENATAAAPSAVPDEQKQLNPARQITPPESFSPTMWHPRVAAAHAEPRVGMPRSVSHDGNLSEAAQKKSKDSAASARRNLSMAPPPAAEAAPAAPVGAVSPVLPVPSNKKGGVAQQEAAQTIKTPFGYVKGAICIEPPKRQRTAGSTAAVSKMAARNAVPPASPAPAQPV